MAIREDRVIVEDADTGCPEEISADAVVLSLGVRSETKLYNELKNRMERVKQLSPRFPLGACRLSQRQAPLLKLDTRTKKKDESAKMSVLAAEICHCIV